MSGCNLQSASPKFRINKVIGYYRNLARVNWQNGIITYEFTIFTRNITNTTGDLPTLNELKPDNFQFPDRWILEASSDQKHYKHYWTTLHSIFYSVDWNSLIALKARIEKELDWITGLHTPFHILQDLHGRLVKCKEEHDRILGTLTNREKRLAKNRKKLDQIRGQIKAIEKELPLGAKLREVISIENPISKKEDEVALHDLKTFYNNLEKGQISVDAKISHLDESITNLTQKIGKLETLLADLTIQHESLREDSKQHQQFLKDSISLTSEAHNLGIEIRNKTNELGTKEGQIKNLKKDIEELSVEINQNKEKLKERNFVETAILLVGQLEDTFRDLRRIMNQQIMRFLPYLEEIVSNFAFPPASILDLFGKDQTQLKKLSKKVVGARIPRGQGNMVLIPSESEMLALYLAGLAASGIYQTRAFRTIFVDLPLHTMDLPDLQVLLKGLTTYGLQIFCIVRPQEEDWADIQILPFQQR
ncbi:MAG: hypothetical protein ACE5OZ_01565 [Candidatus Heimdallarchaeota archaeon]